MEFIDEEDEYKKTSAYTCSNTVNKNNWGVCILNRNEREIIFGAIDYCILGSKDDVKKCDAYLSYKDGNNKQIIAFIELKNTIGNKTTNGLEQLESTINLFKQNKSDDTEFKIKAYLVNRGKPSFANSFKGMQEAFYKKHKVVLRINPWYNKVENIINIE